MLYEDLSPIIMAMACVSSIDYSYVRTIFTDAQVLQADKLPTGGSITARGRKMQISSFFSNACSKVVQARVCVWVVVASLLHVSL